MEQKLEDLYPKHFGQDGNPILSSESDDPLMKKPEKPLEGNTKEPKTEAEDWESKFD